LVRPQSTNGSGRHPGQADSGRSSSAAIRMVGDGHWIDGIAPMPTVEAVSGSRPISGTPRHATPNVE
jgi:hypothetical protein